MWLRAEIRPAASTSIAARPPDALEAAPRVELDDGVVADGVGVQAAADEREVVHVERPGKKREPTGTSGRPRPRAARRRVARLERGRGRHELEDLVRVARARDVDASCAAVDGEARGMRQRQVA